MIVLSINFNYKINTLLYNKYSDRMAKRARLTVDDVLQQCADSD